MTFDHLNNVVTDKTGSTVFAAFLCISDALNYIRANDPDFSGEHILHCEGVLIPTNLFANKQGVALIYEIIKYKKGRV